MRKRLLLATMVMAGALSAAFAGGASEQSAKSSASSEARPYWAKGVDEVKGTLTVYTTMDATQQDILLEEWNKLYPNCKVEIVADSVGTLATKIRSDATSGADVVIGGMFAADGDKYHDILQPYTATNDAEQDFHDPSGYYTFYDVQVMCLVVNPDVLKDLGVSVKGYNDLLNPKLKGKIIIAAPDASSSGYRQLQTVLAVMGDNFDDQKGWDYIAKLIPLCFSTNSSKDVYNLVNEGEYAVGLSYESTPAGIIAQGGAVMQLVYMEEGNTAMPGGAAIVKNAPNLVGAQAMIDLLASTEFQNRRADLAGRGTNKNCKASDLPANSTLGLKDLDYDYLAANKSKLMDHFNDLWSSLRK